MKKKYIDLKNRYFGSYKANYKEVFDYHIKMNLPFKVITTRGTCTIDNGFVKYNFNRKDRDPEFVKVMSLINSLKHSVKRYIKEHGYDFTYQKNLILRGYNAENCKKNIDKRLYCLDLSFCYWTTAYNLGFINKELYKKGVKNSYGKGVLNIGIGTLNKDIYVEEYDRFGVCIRKYNDTEYKKKYSPFYYAIISYVDNIMLEISKLDGFCFYLTDCIYVRCTREYLNIYKQIFDGYGYDYKEFSSKIKDFTDNQIVWWDDKDIDAPEKKLVYTQKEVLDFSYNAIKQ
jgi:hypothetical protein